MFVASVATPDGSLFQAITEVDFRRVAPATGEAVWSYPVPVWWVYGVAATTKVVVSGTFDMTTDFGFASGQVLVQPHRTANGPESYELSCRLHRPRGQLLWVREPDLPNNNGVVPPASTAPSTI